VWKGLVGCEVLVDAGVIRTAAQDVGPIILCMKGRDMGWMARVLSASTRVCGGEEMSSV